MLVGILIGISFVVVTIMLVGGFAAADMYFDINKAGVIIGVAGAIAVLLLVFAVAVNRS